MKVAVIEVKRTGEGDPLEFAVIVRVGDGETRHHVTMVRDTCERLTAGTHCPSPTVRMGLPRADPVGTLKGICTLNQRAPQIWKELPLRSVIPIIALVTVVTANVSLAQSTATPPPESGATCPPDVKGEPPTVGGGSSEPLSDKLAQSKGVICPPAGVDREMEVAPPSGGHLKVIPPPGTPGGDPDVQPK